MEPIVRDVSEADFAQVVVEGSRSRPVVVDFWAEWCGPCRQLSPLLEQMARVHEGEVDVVKLDVDHNPGLSQQFGIQGIPAVKAFVDGSVVAEFTGLQQPAVLQQFFAALVPSPADGLVARALQAPDPDQQAALYRQALEVEADHPGAALGLAGLLDDDEEVAALLARARPTPEVQQAIAQHNLATSQAVDVPALRARVEAGDAEARVPLGRALAGRGEHEEAVAVLLAGVGVPDTRDAAREALVELFTMLGPSHPLVRSARPKLAAALF